MRGIDGYYDIIWADVNIEKINAELQDFQNKYIYKTFVFVDLSKLPNTSAELLAFLAVAIYF